MAEVMIAVYGNYADAVRLRTALVSDGFPTDRIDVTSGREHGYAGVGPADTPRGRLEDYFGNLLKDKPDAPECVTQIASRLLDGSSAVTIHPRGQPEIEQVRRILDRHPPQLLHEQLAPPSGVMSPPGPR
jgi:hypothetical protein